MGDKKDDKAPKKNVPPPPGKPTRKRKKGEAAAVRIPTVTPSSKCKLRLLKLERIKDYLLMEEEYIQNQEVFRPREKDDENDNHCIISSSMGPDYYVSIMSFVNKDLLETGCQKAPLESYADIGGLYDQIQEIKEAVEMPLTHPELYEEIGIRPPKGVVLYGEPGTGKTLLAKAVANQTAATFLRVVGSELVQKYLGEGPKLVRELFRVADDLSPSIVFIDEVDAVGSKRHESSSGGTREIQRTMLELLNQLDGFDERGDVKVIMATNKIESLDPALIRPGRIDRKIDKDDLSGADIKAVCTEAGLLALRERRMRVCQDDFVKAKEKTLYRKKGNIPEGLYL
eukprot:GSChrysophyteH1.ASY1.ANO1.974.1 assembled CDS